MNTSIKCHSEKQTLAAARKFAKSLKAGDVLALEGDLGSGKTTFVKGVAKGLGLKGTEDVTSPTFSLMNIYPSNPVLYHFDLYRLTGVKELESIGFEEFTGDPRAISCIEWAERARNLLPYHAKKIKFEVLDEKSRKITFQD